MRVRASYPFKLIWLKSVERDMGYECERPMSRNPLSGKKEGSKSAFWSDSASSRCSVNSSFGLEGTDDGRGTEER